MRWPGPVIRCTYIGPPISPGVLRELNRKSALRATEFSKSPMKAAQKFSFCSHRATHPRNKTVNKEVMDLTSSCVKPGEAMSGNQLRGNRMHLSTIKPRRIRCDWALGSVTDRQLPAR